MNAIQHSAKKRLVVLGGGFGGLNLVCNLQTRKDLADKLDILLVDKKDYFECNLASPRFLVAPDFHSKMVRNYSDYLKEAKFCRGEVQTVAHQPQEVVVSSEGAQLLTLPYDYLVVCLGTRYPFFKPEAAIIPDRFAEVQQYAQKLQNAQHILVVGGRGVGVEVVGEIIEYFPNKKITLVHPRSSLMDIWPNQGVELVHDFLLKRNVNIILNKRIISSNGNSHTLSDGTVIEADFKLEALGGKPNSHPFNLHFGSSLTEKGFLKVRDTMQLQGYDNIFAMGDICELPGKNNNAILLKGQYPIVAENIVALVNSKPVSPLKLIADCAYPYHLSIGTEYGIGINPFSGEIGGSKEVADHMTNMYFKIVEMPQEEVSEEKIKEGWKKQEQDN